MPPGRKPKTAEERSRAGQRGRPLPVVIGGRIAPSRPPGLTGRMVAVWDFAIADLVEADAIDHADGLFIEGLAVMVGRAREMRAYARTVPVIIDTPQGPVLNRVLSEERAYWAAARGFMEGLPLSPWGRARLGLKARPPTDQVEREIGLPPRLRAVGEDG